MRWLAPVRYVILLCGCIILIFVMLQGVSTTVLFLLEVQHQIRKPRWRDFRYDPKLGWAGVHRP
jgi:hypothetical protein